MRSVQQRALAVFVALVMVLGAAPYLAAQESAPVQGQLVSVDTEAQSLIVQTEAGEQVEFRYTAETQVTGAEEDVAGLASMSGANVTVHSAVDADSGARVATSIEVHPQG